MHESSRGGPPRLVDLAAGIKAPSPPLREARAIGTKILHKMSWPLSREGFFPARSGRCGLGRCWSRPQKLWVVLVLAFCVSGLFSATMPFIDAVAAEVPVTQVTPKPQGTLRILTWNVLAPSVGERLASIVGLDSVAQGRARRLNAAIKRLAPDVIALQEVTADFLRVVGDDPDWQGVLHSTVPKPVDPLGGLVLLSRFPILDYRYRKISSPSGRYALFATVAVGERELKFANVHLESLVESRSERERQLVEVDRRLNSRRATVWLGDFNFGDQDPEARYPLLSFWVDSWTRLHPEAGVTYDVETNPLAKENAFSQEPSRRLDHILLSTDLQPLTAGVVGQSAGKEPPPSDHYGVWVDVRLPGETPPTSVK